MSAGSHPELDRVLRVFGSTPWMTPDQGRAVFAHLTAAGARDVLDIGTCYGTSAAYFAAAVAANGGGRVVTVDSAQFDEMSEASQWVEQGLTEAGVRDHVDVVRIPHSSYAWWLKEQVEQRSDEHGNCTPCFDFVYLDGAKSLTIDGVSVVFIERLLRPGGWLLLDDTKWTFDSNPKVIQTDGVAYGMSEAELREPHIAAVLELIIKPSGAFSVIRREEDGEWAWAQKSATARPRYEVYYTRSLGDRALDRLLHARGRLSRKR
ncbi:MAG: hypothetical protein QOI80_3430 [Solirubrobacteraceae bacterium]|nr:hypothetical protein [Solirubrobacteraceae bacterium]